MPNGNEDQLIDTIKGLGTQIETSEAKHNELITALRGELTTTKAASDEQKNKVVELTTTLTKSSEDIANLRGVVDTMKRQLDQPAISGTVAEARDAIRETTVKHMRDIFEEKNAGNEKNFNEKDCDVSFLPALVEAQRKLTKSNGEASMRHIVANMSEDERKSMTMSQLDGYMFWPEISTIIRTCFLEPIGLQDLYDSFPIAKMSFLYPFIDSHDLLGGFNCSEDCGSVTAATNNIHFRQTRAYDWRALFCTTTVTLEDSAINILTWMANEIALSARMTMNRAWISGDGVNQPRGWLSSGAFPVVSTSKTGQVSAPDLRAFMNAVPYEYGNIVGVMNPDTLAYFASMTDAMGRFILGDNDLFLFQTEITDSRIRLSRYLPPMLPNGTAWTTGSFVAAAANWKKAYITPIRRNMVTQLLPQTQGPWCQSWAHWMQIGGDLVCGAAGRILQVS